MPGVWRWQWHQLDHMQTICTLLQTDNHTNTSSLSCLQAGHSSCHTTNSVKALKSCPLWSRANIRCESNLLARWQQWCGRSLTLLHQPLVISTTQGCIAKNGGGYTQRGVAKGLKVPCLFMITEVSIRCQKNPEGWYTAYSRVYTPQYTTSTTGSV